MRYAVLNLQGRWDSRSKVTPELSLYFDQNWIGLGEPAAVRDDDAYGFAVAPGDSFSWPNPQKVFDGWAATVQKRFDETPYYSRRFSDLVQFRRTLQAVSSYGRLDYAKALAAVNDSLKVTAAKRLEEIDDGELSMPLPPIDADEVRWEKDSLVKIMFELRSFVDEEKFDEVLGRADARLQKEVSLGNSERQRHRLQKILRSIVTIPDDARALRAIHSANFNLKVVHVPYVKDDFAKVEEYVRKRTDQLWSAHKSVFRSALANAYNENSANEVFHMATEYWEDAPEDWETEMKGLLEKKMTELHDPFSSQEKKLQGFSGNQPPEPSYASLNRAIAREWAVGSNSRMVTPWHVQRFDAIAALGMREKSTINLKLDTLNVVDPPKWDQERGGYVVKYVQPVRMTWGGGTLKIMQAMKAAPHVNFLIQAIDDAEENSKKLVNEDVFYFSNDNTGWRSETLRQRISRSFD